MAIPPNLRNDVLKLDTLPNEIIVQIVESLGLDINEPYRTLYEQFFHAEDKWAREAMQKLCLVSRKVGSAAQRALYKDIYVHNQRTLVYLYRSMLERPELGTYTKRVTFDIILGYFADLTPLHLCKGSGFDELWTKQPIEELGNMELNTQLLSVLYFKLLRCTPNLSILESIVLPPPRYKDIGIVSATFMQENSTRPWDDICNWFPYLPKLEILHLMGGEIEGNSLDFVARLCKAFLTLPRVRKMIWSWDDEIWFQNMGYNGNPRNHDPSLRFEKITSLELARTACLPSHLMDICTSFPSLETLSIDRRLHEVIPDDALELVGRRFLSDQLSRLKQLRTLKLGLLYSFNISEILGPTGTLSLISLPKLQTLEVPIGFFVETNPEGEDKVLCPTWVLPKSLRSLTLWVDMRCRNHRKENMVLNAFYKHNVIVLDFLEALCRESPTHFPHLRQVGFHKGVREAMDCVDDPDNYSPPPEYLFYPDVNLHTHHNACEARLESLWDSFEKVGVSFYKVPKRDV
ncbi:hypothetical protein VM1G_10208 [Cytospora mali]|uniref:F-box domain-containing protein n=1 Tax=Cytospora mali TaxID=578113 RepID=A0A194VI20_CYTMA|nr:hypothetical protein VM1G_10208 [Valsa mali]